MSIFSDDQPDYVLSLYGQDHSAFDTISKIMSTYQVVSVTAYYSSGGHRVRIFENMDCWFIDSITGTLDSIRLCLSKGHIADAYGLLRSVIERTWLHIYLLDRSEAEFPVEIDVSSPEKFAESLRLFLESKDSYDDAIESWVAGKNQLPNLRTIRKILNNSKCFDDLNKLFPSSVEISDRCNDHLHVNFARHLLANYDNLQLDKLIPACTQIESDIRYIVTQHLTHLFYIRQHYMSSSDYMDALECGVEPEVDSQYWVAPAVQEFFDELVAPIQPDIVKFLQMQTSMKLVLGLKCLDN